MVRNSEINVLRYDKVVKAFTDDTSASPEVVSKRTGVALSTVVKIWDGTISRPPTVVLDRLRVPRRCPECRNMCSSWPCIPCEMSRRRDTKNRPSVEFIYRRGPH